MIELVEPETYHDDRGSFRELLNTKRHPFYNMKFIQQNVSVNVKNVFRGLHYQEKYPQGKMVTVFRGRVLDFIIDLRKSSPDYKKLQIFELHQNKINYLFVPQYFAHGFFVLEENTVFSYNVFDNAREPKDERCISPYSIPELMQVIYKYTTEKNLIIADKDRNGLNINEAPVYA